MSGLGRYGVRAEKLAKEPSLSRTGRQISGEKAGKRARQAEKKSNWGNGARGEKPELGRGDRRKRANEGCGKVLKGRAGGAVKDVAGGKNSGGRAR